MARKRNKKRRVRVIWNRNCPDCDEGWRRVKVERRGKKFEAVERCHCYRAEIIPDLPPGKKKIMRDGKQAAVGE